MELCEWLDSLCRASIDCGGVVNWSCMAYHPSFSRSFWTVLACHIDNDSDVRDHDDKHMIHRLSLVFCKHRPVSQSGRQAGRLATERKS